MGATGPFEASGAKPAVVTGMEASVALEAAMEVPLGVSVALEGLASESDEAIVGTAVLTAPVEATLLASVEAEEAGAPEAKSPSFSRVKKVVRVSFMVVSYWKVVGG